jgi:hypothetical protein
MADRTRREFADTNIETIANAYHAWRGEKAGLIKMCRGSAKRRNWRISRGTITSDAGPLCRG